MGFLYVKTHEIVCRVGTLLLQYYIYRNHLTNTSLFYKKQYLKVNVYSQISITKHFNIVEKTVSLGLLYRLKCSNSIYSIKLMCFHRSHFSHVIGQIRASVCTKISRMTNLCLVYIYGTKDGKLAVNFMRTRRNSERSRTECRQLLLRQLLTRYISA